MESALTSQNIALPENDYIIYYQPFKEIVRQYRDASKACLAALEDLVTKDFTDFAKKMVTENMDKVLNTIFPDKADGQIQDYVAAIIWQVSHDIQELVTKYCVEVEDERFSTFCMRATKQQALAKTLYQNVTQFQAFLEKKREILEKNNHNSAFQEDRKQYLATHTKLGFWLNYCSNFHPAEKKNTPPYMNQYKHTSLIIIIRSKQLMKLSKRSKVFVR